MSTPVNLDDYQPPARFDGNPWTQAQIDEAPASTGPWTTIDTIAFAVPDADPANPQERSFTTPNGTAPGLWYQVIFLDGLGGATAPTAPVQNTIPGTAPAAFASPNDLATWLGIDLTSEEAERADALLTDASNIIREEVKRGDLGLVTDETITMNGTTDESILLPSTPVVSVSAVTIDGAPLVEGSDWYLDGNMIVRLPATSVILNGIDGATFPAITPGFGSPRQTLQITYTHGYPEIPGKVKTICLGMVVRVWINPGSVARESVGDTSTVYDNNRFSPTGMQLTDDERRALKRLFGSTTKSVSVGR